MLVLSRHENQKVLFTNLDISVSVISVRSKRVKLGFEAPDDIQLLRDELAAETDLRSRPTGLDPHAIRNRISSVVLSLHVLSQDPEEVETAIAKAIWELNELNRELDGTIPVSFPTASRNANTEALLP